MLGKYVKYIIIISTLWLSACANPNVETADELNARYEEALLRTASASAAFTANSAAEKDVLARLEAYFAVMTPESVSAQTPAVYAADAFLYDNVAAVQGVDAIQNYLFKAAQDVEELRVEFLQVARADRDYYIRWKMIIRSDALASGSPLVSYGVTQFRFDSEGRVLVHRDFWDASTGLYEHLPVVGGWMQRVRGALGGHAEAG